jgi:putative sterol carrier protein
VRIKLLSMAAEEFLHMLSGELDPMDAFASGKLKVGGNVFHAMKLAPVFKFGA